MAVRGADPKAEHQNHTQPWYVLAVTNGGNHDSQPAYVFVHAGFVCMGTSRLLNLATPDISLSASCA